MLHCVQHVCIHALLYCTIRHLLVVHILFLAAPKHTLSSSQLADEIEASSIASTASHLGQDYPDDEG